MIRQPIPRLAVTGHRPEKLGGHSNGQALREFARAQFHRLNPALVILLLKE